MKGVCERKVMIRPFVVCFVVGMGKTKKSFFSFQEAKEKEFLVREIDSLNAENCFEV